jgi:hypothetical protein
VIWGFSYTGETMENEPKTLEEALAMIEGYRKEIRIMWEHADRMEAETRSLRSRLYRAKIVPDPVDH